MATVRFSDELKRRIRHNATEMFSARITAAEDAYREDWGIRIYELMFVANKQKMLDMPVGYFELDNDITLKGFKGEGWDTDLNYMVDDLALGSDLPFPRDVDSEGNIHGVTSFHYGSTMLDATDARWDAIKEEYLAYATAIHTLEKERDDFRQGVVKIINNYVTLAPALKAWPALWDLLPSGTQERHKLIIPRKKASRLEEVDVDLGKLTSAVVADKLSK